MSQTSTPYPPGARIVVREAEWMVRSCTATEHDGFKIRATGVSELVRDEDAVFFTELENPKPVLLRPEETVLVPDQTPRFAMSRLFLEATLRRTPLPQSERGLALPDRFLLDPLTYQQRPVELALKGLRPRVLLADVVGLGKTLEIGLILAELIRRGRGERILVVTPQQVLEQFQQELWTRFAIPLIRLDSVGIQRIQREIPAGRNPFTFYKRIIISIDTLKGDAYRHHLDNMHWDAVIIDESHNLIGESSFRNKLAKRLAPKTDALLLASATPHNGNAESFGELISMLDPAALADKRRYEAKDIEHLYIRRTKISPEVTNEIGGKWRERGPSQAVRCPATPSEERVLGELTATWLGNHAPGVTNERRLFPYTLLKAFLSSHRALAKTVENRLKNATDEPERQALTALGQLAGQITDDDSAKLAALVARLREIGVGPASPARAVVFSESVPTLKWLHQVLPKRLGLTKPGQALGFAASRRVLDVERSGETFGVPVACHGQNVVAVDCGWAADTDAALDADRAGRLLDPVQTGSTEWVTAGAKLARWLFDTDEPPRYVLLLHGGVIILADRFTWAEGRYLAVSLDSAIERADQAELETIAALFSADVLQPPAEGGSEQLAHWVDESRKHAVGVSGELREGVRESVQIIANEVLDRVRSHGLEPGDVAEPADLAKELGRDALRYLYRILFLLYAEARPELGILPADDQDYVAGYSMQRLGELAARRLIGEEARSGFHLYESLDLLFRMVNDGHRARGHASAEGLSEGEGLRFESLKADLFEPSRTRLIGRIPDPRCDDEAPLLDTRLRDEALHKVLRRLMLAKGSGRKGKNQRGGFISYAQLGINQLGAVYEGLMSYSGFIAAEELYEVAKKGDPSGGSWMIPASKVAGYGDDVFVMEKDENGFPTGERVRYRPGAFVYRLAGRDRQTSASYYTPQSLTSVTVHLALEQRIKEEGRPVTAAEVLRWRVCEPALGSGAFLNEAIDQLAALYLRLREEETGDRLEADQRTLALQKIKAYIALHSCYGVDLNETAVELAEVSIWLNVMHRGLQAPWFGLHLVRGNSLIGAGRRLYPAGKLAKGEWLKSAPEDLPFSAGPVPSGHIHHFLLPAEGWGAVAGEKEAKDLASEDTKRLAGWRKSIRKPPSSKKTLGHKLSQVQRVQALTGRAEYLWSLVIERLRISEREISRTIDVWGAQDLPAAQEAKPREEILADLTSPGTPYWRLKAVMDAWCALWFWPVDKAGLLDGSDAVYATEPEPVMVDPEPAEPSPVFPATYIKASLFDDEPEQLTLAAAAPRQPSAAKKPRVVRRAQVPLKDFEDWLEFAESVLGRQDIPADSLAGHFTTLSDLSGYEDQLPIYMGMDPFQLLGQRFPWLDTAEDITAQQGFFHWELRFAQVFSNGGFDLQLGNPPWVRPRWEEDTVLAEFDPWFELVEKSGAEEKKRRKVEVLSSPTALAFYHNELTGQTARETFFGNVATNDLLVGTQPDLYRAFMIRTWRNIGLRGAVGLVHPDTHFGGDREKILRGEAYLRLRIHGGFVNAGQRFFPPPVGHATHFGIHIYGRQKEIGFTHLSWLTDVSIHGCQDLAFS